MSSSNSSARNPRFSASLTNHSTKTETPTDTRITYSIDFLRYTIPFELGVEKACPDHPLFEITGEVEPVRWRNYDRVIQLPHGKIAYHSERPECKIYVELTGRDLYDPHHKDFRAIDLLKHAIHQDANITRLDFAVDYFGPSSPKDLIDAEADGRLKTPAKTRGTHNSVRRNGQDGSHTFYLGSSDSGRYFKCYDKAAEMKCRGPWTRMELTLRKRYANEVARKMLASSVEIAGKEAIRKYVRCDDVGWFNQALSGPSVEMPQLDQKPPNTRGWLLNDVPRSLEKQIHADAEEGNFEIYEQYLGILEGVAAIYHLAPFYPSSPN